MKITALIFGLLTASHAEANDYCKQRQQLEAQIALAQKYGFHVYEVKVAEFVPGMWTAERGNNVGSDQVTVRVNIPEGCFGLKEVSETYSVRVQQIGETPDCKIISITKD